MAEHLKSCSMCGKILPLGCFHLRLASGERRAQCKVCAYQSRRRRRAPSETSGTVSYFKTNRWNDINRRTINGARPNYKERSARAYLNRGIRLEMSKDEFYAWCDQHSEEILSLWEKGEIPSVDRKDPEGHYSLDNIRVLSWRENSALGIKNTILRRSKPLLATDKDGKVTRFSSIHEAVRAGYNQGTISKCLRKVDYHRRHHGMTWEFEESSARDI